MSRPLLLALLVSSCGGHAHEKPTPVAPPVDAELAFRRGYSNPGGMWMPSQMTLPQHAEALRRMGVKLPVASLSDPLSPTLASIVSLGGCTGSFVSPDGLIVTNHHCVQDALQLSSTETDNLVDKGFLAKTRADEKTAGPAQHVSVVQAYRDVTHEVRDGLDALKDATAREHELEKREKTLVAACEKGRPGIRCHVTGFFRGGQYQLIEALEIRDVRLVYAPARSVGDYGGEIDNWEWPRHTGDWSFFRAYVGKDGRPADFSADNVPYKPAHHLKVTTAGLHAGDFVMVTGYPGYTNRMATASEVHHDVEWTYPYIVDYYKALYGIADAHLGDAGETGIKAGVQKQMYQNGLENQEGTLANLVKGDLLSRKDALDAKVQAWAAQPGHEQTKAAIAKLEALIAEERRTERADSLRDSAFGGSSLLATALSDLYWADERPKPDAERRAGHQDRDMPDAIAETQQLGKQYDRTLDRAVFRLTLVRALGLPAQERTWLPLLLGTKKPVDAALIDKTIDGWYATSNLEDENLRLELLQHATTKSLGASHDPFVMAARRVWPVFKAEEKKSEARYGDLLLVRPAYASALREMAGGAVAPDANSTLRITYGTVKPLPGGDAFTVASQILKKETGKEPFDSPPKLLAAIRDRELGPYADASLGGELPIDFLSDLDITGGNSGSPTLNDKGELVGLAFDGNKEGIASDVVFNGATTRTIHVDARYMIWTMEHLDGAQHLVGEMGLPIRMKR